MAEHTPAEREAVYDAEIAPVLMQLNKRCAEVGMCFLAFVEWEPGEGGTTIGTTADMGVGAKTVYSAMKAKGNADALISAMMKYAEKHGHTSVFLHLLEMKTGQPTNVIGLRTQDIAARSALGADASTEGGVE